MRNEVTISEVQDFKEKYCNENGIIANILATVLKDYVVEPILDVGAGMGDIASLGFPDKQAICIDMNEIDSKIVLSDKHIWQTIDFFDYQPQIQIETILFAHSLQFLDDDITRLNRQIDCINPCYVITVVNDNDDIMGDIITWTKAHFLSLNPEIQPTGFPKNYKLVTSHPFKVEVQCPDFDTLANQIGYFMLVDIKDKAAALVDFLYKKLNGTPDFHFGQTLYVYERLASYD